MTGRPLTDRRLDVLRHAARGLSCQESGRLLGLSCNTVGVHRHWVLRILGAANMVQAVVRALDDGLITIDEVRS